MEYEIKQLDIDSKEEINGLYNCLRECFKMNYEYFEWKHLFESSNYLDRFTYCIFYQRKCIATLQIIVSELYIYNQLYHLGLAVDGATDAEHRGRGLYKKLLEYAMREMSSKNIDFILAFGNQISRKPLINDYQFFDFARMISGTYQVRYNKVFLAPVNLLIKLSFQLITLLKKHSYYTVSEISKSVYLEFLRLNIYQFDIYFGKKSDQIDWRLSKPHSHYKFFGASNNHNHLTGVALVNILNDKIYIEDILSEKHQIKALGYLICHIKSIAFSDVNIKKINFSSNYSEVLMKIFKGNGFKINNSAENVLIKKLTGDYREVILNGNAEMHFTRIDKNE